MNTNSSIITSMPDVGTFMSDSGSIDAFARLRVSNPATLFDTQLQYDLNQVLWQNRITNTSGNASVTHLPLESAGLITVGANDTVTRQSRQYLRYQPGKSQLIMATFAFGTPTANLSQRVGYFDDDNGIYFENDGVTSRVAIRSNTSGTPQLMSIPQANWNLDRLDGTGKSGITLDVTTTQIFIADVEWLGVGRVRIGFVLDGLVVYVHEFLNANNLPTVYMTTANLPVRYEMVAGAVAGTHSMRCICTQVTSEGGVNEILGLPFSATNANTLRTVGSGAYLPLLSIRPKLTFNGVTNRSLIVPEVFGIFSDSENVHFRLIAGGTITSPSWSSAGVDSLFEFDVSATAISGGIDVLSDYASSGGGNSGGGTLNKDIATRIPLTLDIDGNHPTSPYTDVLTVAAISLGTNTDCGAFIDWKELR